MTINPTPRMTRTELSAYPDPDAATLPRKVRCDGPRMLDGWDIDSLHIEGNEGGKIPTSHLAWLPSLPATAPIEEIRAAYERDGVVHVKGVLPRQDVMNVRRAFFEFLQPSGLLKPNTDPMDGIYSGDDPNVDNTQVRDYRVQTNTELLELTIGAGYLPAVMGFTDHPALKGFIGRLMPEWAEVTRFRKQLMRTNIPHAYKSATRVHYDQMYLRGQKPNTLTAWIPVGDISPISGGLMYLEDSVGLGIEMESKFREYNKTLAVEEQMNGFNENMLEGGGLTRDCTAFALHTKRRWLVGNYQAGDVVFHQCRMIHCSANNEDPEERIRFATDVRFTDKQMKFEDRWDDYGEDE